MPRTHVDAPPQTPLATAAAAAAPFAEALAAAAAPVRDAEQTGRLDLPGVAPARSPLTPALTAAGAAAQPLRVPPPAAPPLAAPRDPAAKPASPQPISFGRRADADIKPVTITPKSIRGYKLPSSSLLYRSDETPSSASRRCATKPAPWSRSAPNSASMARSPRSTPARGYHV